MENVEVINQANVFNLLGEPFSFAEADHDEPPFNFDSPGVIMSNNPISQKDDLTTKIFSSFISDFSPSHQGIDFGSFLSGTDWTLACFEVAEGFMKKDLSSVAKGTVGVAENFSSILEDQKMANEHVDNETLNPGM